MRLSVRRVTFPSSGRGRAAAALGGALSLTAACGGNVFTTATDSDAGTDGASAGGGGSGGQNAGGVSSTGGQSTGGRAATGGLPGTGGFTGAGGAGGIVGAGGGAGTCGIDCSYLNDACHRGVCTSVGCAKILIPDGESCDDHSLCTSGETCQGGVCTGMPVPCAPPPSACQTSACDPSTGQCAAKPANDGASCNDSNTCTTGDTCKGGMCVGSPVGCVDGDGCCPASCTSQNDSDCGSTGSCTNIALQAVATSSGGGVGTRGPAVMNDGVGESSCEFGWVFNGPTPSGAWIELSWPSAVTIGSIYVETENATVQTCGATVPRNLQSGRIQYMQGGSWADIASFGGFTDDVRVDFSNPVTTTDLRIFDMTTAPGGANSMIFEWHVYPETGCKPPP